MRDYRMSSRLHLAWPSPPVPISSVAVLALCGVLGVAHAASPPLPVPCPGGTCGARPFTPSTNPSAGLPTTNSAGNAMTVWQVDQRQIFNWQSFDIDPGYSVHFDQKDASYSALNRIWSADPSRIAGPPIRCGRQDRRTPSEALRLVT